MFRPINLSTLSRLEVIARHTTLQLTPEYMPQLAADLVEIRQHVDGLEAELRAALDALRWFDYRRAPLQSKFDLHGPADTAAALRDQLARVRALLAGVPLAPHLRSIEDAKKDGTRILAKFHDDLFPRIKPGRDDLAPWNGAWAVLRHRGLASDGWDPGWNVAAPVGRGGFPDEWLEGWIPIPATAP